MAAGKVIKTGRVVIMLQGRHAGKKAVVLMTHDSGSRERVFSHALVVGLRKYPKKITKKMPAKVVEKKTQIKVFLKYVNYSHIMPTRYVVSEEIDAQALLGNRKITSIEEKQKLKEEMATVLRQKFMTCTGQIADRDMKFLRTRLQF